jgi:Ca-activated chloride channel homolog
MCRGLHGNRCGRWRCLLGCLAIPFFFLIAPSRAIALLRAQEASFRTLSSELVVLPVVVTDKRGTLRSDLDREQFAIYDNGHQRPIELFTNEDVPVSVGLVIDGSSSMRAKLGEVIAATLRFAQLSNPNDELFTFSFNDDVRDAVPDRRFLLAGDFRVLETALRSLAPQGQTAMYDALMAALDRLEQASRPRKILILISDGGDNASAATLDRVLARARASNAAIYTIGLYDRDDPDRNPKVLQAIAHATGGERFLPESPAPLLRVCERIAREIRSGYTIGFVPPDRDGAYHRVQVSVRSDRSLRVRTRPGYFAAGPS